MSSNKTLVLLDNFKPLPVEFKNYDLLTFGLAAKEALTADNSAKAEIEARAYYLKLVRDLPQNKELSDLLQFNGRTIWWYLNISEKSIWLDKLIHRLYALLRFYYILKNSPYESIQLYVADEILKQVMVKYLKAENIKFVDHYSAGRSLNIAEFIFLTQLANCRTFGRALVQKILAFFLPRYKIVSGSLGFYGVYPSFFTNNDEDLFFNDLPHELAKDYPLNYLFWFSSGFKQFKKISLLVKAKKGIVLGRYLKLGDLLNIFSLRRLFNYFRLYFRIRKLVFSINNIDISLLVQEELFCSLAGRRVPEWILLERVMSRVPWVRYKAIFFRLEFQPVERPLLYHTAHKTTTFGFQHSALSKNFLNYVFLPGELGEQSLMPLPDYILVSGSRGREFMAQGGFPVDRIIISGPIRYIPLFDYLAKREPKERLRQKLLLPLDKQIIFVAPSPLLPETLGMLDDFLAKAKTEVKPSYLIVKLHPNSAGLPGFVPAVEKYLAENAGSVVYEIRTKLSSLYDYISASNMVLLTGGSIALEAAVLGVKPMIYACPSQFAHNPLSDDMLLGQISDPRGYALKIIKDKLSSL